MGARAPLIRLDDIREACTAVVERARQVRIDTRALETYARALPAELGGVDSGGAPPPGLDDPESRAAYVVTLDAINFGSGWFPLLRKPEGKSGFRTLELRLREHVARHGRPEPARLAQLSAADVARIFDQPSGAGLDDLLELFARALRDLGEHVRGAHGGSFLRLVESAGGSAEALVQELLAMPLYRDVASYAGRHVPFLKRAQITAADLHTADPNGFGRFRDLDRLTMFADNLVPHVLRCDGVLEYAPALAARIDAGEPLESGSPEEVEIRAAGVCAVERLVAARRRAGHAVDAATLDGWLWSRGGGASYKARPRHRTRCAYY